MDILFADTKYSLKYRPLWRLQEQYLMWSQEAKFWPALGGGDGRRWSSVDPLFGACKITVHAAF